MTIVTDTSSPGLPHTCKGWGEGGRGGGGTLRGARALWTKIQINICSCLGKNENDVLTIFIFYFYLAAGLTGLTSSIFSWQNDKIKTVRTDPDQGRCDYQVLSSFVWRLNNWPSKYRNVGYLNLAWLGQILWYHLTSLLISSAHISTQLIVFPDELFFSLSLSLSLSEGFCEHFFKRGSFK